MKLNGGSVLSGHVNPVPTEASQGVRRTLAGLYRVLGAVGRRLSDLAGVTDAADPGDLHLVIWYDGDVLTNVRVADLPLMHEVIRVGGWPAADVGSPNVGLTGHRCPAVVVKVVEEGS